MASTTTPGNGTNRPTAHPGITRSLPPVLNTTCPTSLLLWVSCNWGGPHQGLHLGLEAAGVKKGDKVITTPYTFTATAEVIRYLGAHPLFIDIDRDRFTISAKGVAEALEREPGVKAIIPVHYGGLACEMEPILDAARLNSR